MDNYNKESLEYNFRYMLKSPAEYYDIVLGFVKYKDLDSELGVDPSFTALIKTIQENSLECELLDFIQWEADEFWYWERDLWMDAYCELYWQDDFFMRYERDNYRKHWHTHIVPPTYRIGNVY